MKKIVISLLRRTDRKKNFHLNKLDKVHPEFKKLIKEIEDEVAR